MLKGKSVGKMLETIENNTKGRKYWLQAFCPFTAIFSTPPLTDF